MTIYQHVFNVLCSRHLVLLLFCAQPFQLSSAQETLTPNNSQQSSAKQTAKPMKKPVAIFYSPQFLLHETGANHPERPERLHAVVAQLKQQKKLIWPAFEPASQADLALVHTPAYLALVDAETKALASRKGDGQAALANLSTGDTVMSPTTQAVAKLAVGAGIAASDAVMAGRASSAFALVRPPGHHATQSRGMGFCVYNNIAIAARHLQKQHGIKRILIVDFDVHHGNGTQAIFEADPSVFYFSIHQHPLYPGTGLSSETGVGKGKGYTLNVALPAGAGDDELLNAVRQQLIPAMEAFKPEFILVSAGFDSHSNDPLGRLEYSDQGYAQVTKELVTMANRYAVGRMVYMLEGGYNPNNIASAVNQIVDVLNHNAMIQ
jgi:acetoin utilization deacetylase AcuC-like enzyme